MRHGTCDNTHGSSMPSDTVKLIGRHKARTVYMASHYSEADIVETEKEEASANTAVTLSYLTKV